MYVLQLNIHYHKYSYQGVGFNKIVVNLNRFIEPQNASYVAEKVIYIQMQQQ